VYNVLLQVLDDGRLTDGQGRVVNFRNTVIIMTSNIGSHLIEAIPAEATENEAEMRYERMRDQVTEELRRHLRPELINRIDEIIVFHALNRDQITRIVDLLLKRTDQALAERKMRLQVTDAAKRVLAEQGFDPLYGARPLRRTIQRLLENPISSGILRREFRKATPSSWTPTATAKSSPPPRPRRQQRPAHRRGARGVNASRKQNRARSDLLRALF
jgi:ATP-dependent Clp protease ATP-binding subunit ClpA